MGKAVKPYGSLSANKGSVEIILKGSIDQLRKKVLNNYHRVTALKVMEIITI